MGGYGSGERYGTRDTTDGYRKLDVRYLQREKLLEVHSLMKISWSNRGEVVGYINVRPSIDRITLNYKTRRGTEEWESHDYDVSLERTPCHYGGERVWFRCPAVRCGRRVAVLYGGRIFACRKCYSLAYPSQSESRGDRADRRAWALRERCGDHYGCLLDPFPPRPKGMHERTYHRLQYQYARSIHTSVARIAAKIGMPMDSFNNF